MKTIKWREHILSKLCLGTVQFGMQYGIANKGERVSQEEAHDIISFVMLNGINCLDTAQGYGDSEEVIGNFFRNNGDCANINIISKIKSNNFNVTTNELLNNLKESLKMLSFKHLFGLLLHDSQLLHHGYDIIQSKVKFLKEENILKYFGVSIYTDEEFNLANDCPSVDIIQIPFNMFDQRAITKKWIKKANNNNKLLFIRSVYLQGLLLMEGASVPLHFKEAKVYLKKLDIICRNFNISKNELALAFVNDLSDHSIILFGCDSQNQAMENIKTYNRLTTLGTELKKEVFHAFQGVDEKIYMPTMW